MNGMANYSTEPYPFRGTDNQELVNLVAAGNRDDKIINGIKADTRAVIFRLGQKYHIDLFDRQRQIISGHAVCHRLYELDIDLRLWCGNFQAAEHCR